MNILKLIIKKTYVAQHLKSILINIVDVNEMKKIIAILRTSPPGTKTRNINEFLWSSSHLVLCYLIG